MEPGQAIAIIETDLRRLIRAAMRNEGNWLTRAFGEEAVAELGARQLEESRRRSPAVVPSDPLEYTHLYQLRTLINKNWQLFASPLGAKKDFDVLIGIVEDFRNAPAHSRELLPHERLLLEGIAGKIRTQVTNFVSTQSADAKHYPIIELVRDSFGNTASESKQIVATGLTLQVGDVVTYQCRGWDSQGRELTWRWGVTSAISGPATTGTEVEIQWVVKPEHVASFVHLEIQLLSNGQFHRHRFYDDEATFRYTVDPPTV